MIFFATESPIPLIEANLSVGTSESCRGNLSIVNAAEGICFGFETVFSHEYP
jgi:hypothetical protein